MVVELPKRITYMLEYYNRKKPKWWLIQQCESRIASIDDQITRLQQDKAEIQQQLEKYRQ